MSQNQSRLLLGNLHADGHTVHILAMRKQRSSPRSCSTVQADPSSSFSSRRPAEPSGGKCQRELFGGSWPSSVQPQPCLATAEESEPAHGARDCPTNEPGPAQLGEHFAFVRVAGGQRLDGRWKSLISGSGLSSFSQPLSSSSLKGRCQTHSNVRKADRS